MLEWNKMKSRMKNAKDSIFLVVSPPIVAAYPDWKEK